MTAVLPDRYEDLGLLGTGGMGEVRRVRDRLLRRTLAMKILHAELLGRPALAARFVEEAQVVAQLQHPGIVPVYEIGALADGRKFFTMREVQGRTLGEVIAEVHAASPPDRWGTSRSGWTFRRLVDAIHRVCEAVDFAHARGVVHRDLKPENIMVGGHGEVLVLDWGLAKILGRAAEDADIEPVATDRSRAAAHLTRAGVIAGTPAYMAPEQARGRVDRIDARTDVYALGAVLHTVLVGRPPPSVLPEPDEPPISLLVWGGARVPAELADAAQHALARDRASRYAHAGALANAIGAWLEGARRREQALLGVARAAALGPDAQAVRAWAASLRREAEALLAPTRPWDPEERKAPGWQKQDEAADLEVQAELLEIKSSQALHAALQVDPTLVEAHEALSRRYHAEHAAAEAARDGRAAARADTMLRGHLAELPERSEVRADIARYLKGDGALTLLTEPEGAEVRLYRFERRNRRLVPELVGSLGRTPLVEVPLPMGSYVCVLERRGRARARYPIRIGRLEHWDGVRPGDLSPTPVVLPAPDELEVDDVYVPPGFYVSGGDPQAPDALPERRLWTDAFVIRRFVVTNREYVAFLDDLVERGREGEAVALAPRYDALVGGTSDALVYGRDRKGRFVLGADREGDVWLPEWPVVMIDWHSAGAYCRWHAERSGRPWRLAGELEFEKAARGVDGRFFPWGDVLDPSWCCTRDSHPGKPTQARVQEFPIDESPYGLRGAGGGVRTYCADRFTRDGPDLVAGRVQVPEPLASPERVVSRGGNWRAQGLTSRCAFRVGIEPGLRTAFHGIRPARSYVAGEGAPGRRGRR